MKRSEDAVVTWMIVHRIAMKTVQLSQTAFKNVERIDVTTMTTAETIVADTRGGLDIPPFGGLPIHVG